MPLITPDLWLRDCHSPPLPNRSPSPQRLHSPSLPGPAVPQLRISSKLFDRQTRKRKRTTVEDTVPPVYPKFPPHAPVYCTPPICRSPAFTQSQSTSSSIPTNADPTPSPLYPLNLPPSLLPPPMILVPYPIMLPIPIPIPIPIPLPFLQKECDKSSNTEKNEKK